MYDWDDYRYILAISEAKSLPAAAKDLGVAVSTVMRRHEKIQAKSDLPIFIKTENGYQLTEMGSKLKLIAQSMSDQALLAESYLRNSHESLQGRFRISGSEVIVPFFLSRHIPEIQNENPEIEVELVVQDKSPSHVAQEFDLSFWPKCPSNPELFGRKLTDLKWAVYGSKSSRPESELIGFTGGDGAKLAMSLQEANHGKSETKTSANKLITAAALAASNGPLAFLPCLLGESWPNLERKSDPTDHEIGELWVVYRKELRHTKRIKYMLSKLIAAAKNDAKLFLG